MAAPAFDRVEKSSSRLALRTYSPAKRKRLYIGIAQQGAANPQALPKIWACLNRGPAMRVSRVMPGTSRLPRMWSLRELSDNRADVVERFVA